MTDAMNLEIAALFFKNVRPHIPLKLLSENVADDFVSKMFGVLMCLMQAVQIYICFVKMCRIGFLI